MVRISVIIPVYNEELVIEGCLNSLSKQTLASETEIIVVDDGSTDKTARVVQNTQSKVKNLTLLSGLHGGPGVARNLGAKNANGEILVFVDADMEFGKDFLKDLTAPIGVGTVIGTYSTEELLLNKENPWAVCWNLNFFNRSDKALKNDGKSTFSEIYLSLKGVLEKIETRISPIAHQNVSRLASTHSHLPFRAILKSRFDSVGGFSSGVGYTDDWTLAEKLNQLPTPTRAEYFHRNPATPGEVFRQARWIGRGQLMTGNLVRRLHSLAIHNPVVGTVAGLVKAVQFQNPLFPLFRIIYDTGVFVSVLASFVSKNTAR